MQLAKYSENLPVKLEDLARFVLIGREKLQAVKAGIRAIEKLDLAKEVMDQKKNEAQDLAGALLDAEVRIGQLFKALPKASGERTDLQPSNTGVTRSTTKQETVENLGFNKMQASRFETLAEHLEIVEQVKAEAIENDDLPTRTEVLNRVKNLQREKEIISVKQNIENKPFAGQYDVIVIDPPWPYGREYDPDTSRVANPYPEMSLEEIADLKLPMEESTAVVFLWTTHAFLKHAFGLLEKWGLMYKATIVWDKEKMGMGATIRMQCEFCLLAVKGKPLLQGASIRDIIREPRREHSRKPIAFYELVEKLTVGTKLDYFSREQREGWDAYGAETGKF